MTLSVTHTTVAVGTNAGNGEIHKEQWNEAHTLTMASDKILGRTTSGEGTVEELSAESVRSLLDTIISFDTIADLKAHTFTTPPTKVHVFGYSALYDCEPIFLKYSAVEPSHYGKFQSADGSWWEIGNRILTPKMFGAVGDDSTNDATALTQAFSTSGSLRRPLRDDFASSGVIYKITSTVNLPAYADIIFEEAKIHYTGSSSAINITGSNWRFQARGGLYGDSQKTITGITKANPAVVTCASHGFTTGDRVRISDVEGMEEVNLMNFTVTVINANSFSLDGINSSAYTNYTSGGTAKKFVSAHSGLYGNLSNTSPVNIVWIENVDFSGTRVWGFGDTGIDINWVRDFKFDDIYAGYCGWAGILLLSAVRGNSNGRIEIRDIGPGSGSVTGGYGVAFSRWPQEGLSYDDAPRSQLIHMDEIYARNIPYYGIGFDTHGGLRVSLNHLKTDYCHIGCNLEASPDDGNAASDYITIGSFDLTGCDPSRHDIGPGFAIDAVYWGTGGGDEIAKGISIGSGTMRWHGHKNTFGNAVFSDGAAVYITNVRGITIGDIRFVDCYKRAVRTVQDCDGITFSNLVCVDLVSDGGTQEMFQFGAETFGTVDNIVMVGSAGTVFNVQATFSAGYGVKVGRNITHSSGITKFSAAAIANLEYEDDGTWSPTAAGLTNADSATFAGCQYIQSGDRVICWGQYTIDPTATGNVVAGCPLPVASDFTLTSDASGNFNFAETGVANSSGAIYADTTNNRVTFQHDAATTLAKTAYFWFGYIIK